jgi:ATP-dependent DNA helicase Rep
VIAGAGSGKTRVITQKIVNLVESGFEPRAISAITFTNKAAQEMEERLKTLLEGVMIDGKSVRIPKEKRPRVCTFHSLGVQILRKHSQRLGLKNRFSILDSDDQIGLILQALATTDRKLAAKMMWTISLWKNQLIEPEQAVLQAADNTEALAAKVYLNYDTNLRAYQSVDFDDLIRLPVQLFRQDEEALTDWQRQIRYLLVDEYQDTNACQYELLKLIVGPRAAFTAVGDDDQSIYGWRGATLDNLKRLPEEFPQLKVIKLEQNYRSSRHILDAANSVIQRNPKLHEKKLWSDHGVGDPVMVLPMDSEEHEAESILMRLQAHKFERRAKFSDYAILYRSNFQARVFEQALRKERVPYVMSGGQSFFDRAEVRDLCAYLRLLVNDDDDPAFIRAITTPKRGIGAATLQALGNYSAERNCSMFAAMFESGAESKLGGKALAGLREFGDFVNRMNWRAQREPAGEVLDDLIKAIDYKAYIHDQNDEKTAAAKWTNTTDFIDWVKKRVEDDGKNLIETAQTIALISRLDSREGDSDTVKLSTLHAAKGLEYPHVFLVGVEEGLLPHNGDTEAGDDIPEIRIEEERRLMYVGITRAQRSLHVSWAKQRKRGREITERMPSRFIAEMRSADAATAAQADADAKPMSARERLALMKEMMQKKA